ncbi:DUF6089 family protein [Mucilaginibacter sp.]|uniref:type IX secretion system protein PorG n=1 Tax=Mucilaginibacter sp. TaxID=1882438 RepID=UPI0035BBE505
MPKLLAAILLVLISVSVNAQTWEVGGALGGAGYIGDLNTNNPVKPSGGSVGVFVKRNFNGYLAAKLNFTYGQISGADSTSNGQQVRNRNLSFVDPLKELSMQAELNFMKYIPDVTKNRYTPYIFVGGGLTSYAPRAIYNGEKIGLRSLRTEGQPVPYKQYAVVIPYGAGFKYNFHGKWTVAAELGYRYTNTDYLDDVSGVYANPSSLPNPTSVILADRSGERTGGSYIGTPGSQRGDFKPHDIYMFAGFTLSYTFVTQKCYFEN